MLLIILILFLIPVFVPLFPKRHTASREFCYGQGGVERWRWRKKHLYTRHSQRYVMLVRYLLLGLFFYWFYF